MIIDGKKEAEIIRSEIKKEISDLKLKTKKLRVLQSFLLEIIHQAKSMLKIRKKCFRSWNKI